MSGIIRKFIELADSGKGVNLLVSDGFCYEVLRDASEGYSLDILLIILLFSSVMWTCPKLRVLFIRIFIDELSYYNFLVYLDDVKDTSSIYQAYNQYRIGVLLRQKGQSIEALKMFDHARCSIKDLVSERTHEHDKNEDELLYYACQMNMASIFGNEGQLSQSLYNCNQAISKLKHHFGEESLHVARALNTCAQSFKVSNDYTSSLRYYEKAMHICEKLNEKADEAKILSNMSLVYLKLGNLEAALKSIEKSLHLKQSFEPSDSNELSMAISLNNKGIILCAKGELEKSILCHKLSLAIKEKYSQKNQFSISQSYYDLASVQLKAGQSEEAVESAKNALEIRRTLLKPSNYLLRASENLVASITIRK